ncbi:MAG: type II toxin-antitoxin system RelE/ParE family toxin [Chloroflexi bacterium]|nr:type II toxin-antitoxin system RelE/ParE family toxin [Chloroflexota bacterium]
MSRYIVYITPRALREIKDLPGNVRQRVKHAVDDFAENPRPSDSKVLQMPQDVEVEVVRFRIDKWRIVYAISETEETVDVLAIRKRPPYDYGDLEKLLNEIE